MAHLLEAAQHFGGHLGVGRSPRVADVNLRRVAATCSCHLEGDGPARYIEIGVTGVAVRQPMAEGPRGFNVMLILQTQIKPGCSNLCISWILVC